MKEPLPTTLAIRKVGESTDMEVITSNKLTAKLRVKCLEIPHFAKPIPEAIICYERHIFYS